MQLFPALILYRTSYAIPENGISESKQQAIELDVNQTKAHILGFFAKYSGIEH